MAYPGQNPPAYNTQDVPMYAYPPPQPAYPAIHTAPPPFMPSAPASSAKIVFGSHSMQMTCPHCLALVSTETSKEHQCFTHCCCLLLFLSLPIFSCLPYFIMDPETVTHMCPNCRTQLGVYHR